MRKLPPIPTMLVAVAVLALASLTLRVAEAPLRGAGGAALRAAAGAARAAADRAVPRALAQETLEFEPVPAESLDDADGSSGTGHIRIREDDQGTEVVLGRSGNVLRFGSDVHVDPDQVIAGDLVVMAADIVVEGHVEGDVVALGGDVTLRSTARVDGDVACMGGVLTEDPGAAVGGQRVTASGIGDVMRERSERSHQRAARATMRRAWSLGADLAWLLVMVGLAWGFTRLGAQRTAEAVARLKREPAVSIGIGALVWALVIPSVVALAIIVAILCITIIGIPLALAALLGYCLFLVLTYLWGYIVASAVVGEWILKRSGSAGSLATGATAAAVEPSLTRMAIVGVLVLGGLKVLGGLMKGLWFIGWLGGLIAFLACIAIAVAATFGGGAWLRTEFTTGTLGRWWQGRRATRPAGGPPPAGGAPAPPAPTPPAPAPSAAPTSSAPSTGSDPGSFAGPYGTPGVSPGPQDVPPATPGG